MAGVKNARLSPGILFNYLFLRGQILHVFEWMMLVIRKYGKDYTIHEF